MALSASDGKKTLGSPELDGAVRQLVAIHGARAVKDSVGRLAKGRSGPKKIEDWEDVWPYLESDLIAILQGGKPSVSNRAIARRLATKNPRHNWESSFRRIQRKLAAHREHYALALAAISAAAEAPIDTYIEVTAKLASGRRAAQIWRSIHENAVATRRDYEAVFGQAGAEVTYAQAKGLLLAHRSPRPKGLGLGIVTDRQKCQHCGSDIFPRE